MNITPSYLIKPFNTMNSRMSNKPLQTNPTFGVNIDLTKMGVGKSVIGPTVAAVAAAAATTTVAAVAAIQNGKANSEPKNIETDYGSLEHVPGKSLVATRKNGMKIDLIEGIPQETLQSPVIQHVHQAKSSKINPNAGVTLTQNKSNKPVEARKITIEGTLEENLVNNNINNVPLKFDIAKDSQMINAPWSDQYVTQKCFMVRYGTVDKSSFANEEYLNEYTDPKTGKAPDVAILAAQKGVEDRSFVPADIAKGQYEIVLENGERIPCDYEKMEPGKVYMIAKKECQLKMAVPPTEVISSEDEKLPAGKLYMVDSMGHFYNGQPIKRIKSGEVTWNADMNDPVQANIRNLIDESLSLEAKAKEAKESKDVELAEKLNAQAKQLTKAAEQAMTDYVLSAQNKNNEEFFA